MIDKFKNIKIKVLILVLVLTLFIPATVFAGTHTVNNWDEYRDKIIEDIMKQEETITINFNGSEFVGTEYTARLKVDNEYENSKNKIPRIFSELNISNELTSLELNSDKQIESITHAITYKSSKLDFDKIRLILNKQYPIIRTKATDYEKIKVAYDYIVDELKEPALAGNISDILSKQGNNSHAVLFSMMMAELGYENDIASKGVNKWNLVKIQGYWYHVNAMEDDKCFLTTKSYKDWEKEKHTSKIPLLAIIDYNGTQPELPQIIYEVELTKTAIENTLGEIKGMSDGISMVDILEIKKKFAIIEEKVKSYKEIKGILQGEAIKLSPIPNIDFVALEGMINNLTETIRIKKHDIVNKAIDKAETTFEMIDISAAIEAITLSEDKLVLEEKMKALELAVVAITKAERTKLITDITQANSTIANIKTTDLKEKLNLRIKVLEATIAVENAEKTRKTEDVVAANKLVDGLVEGQVKKDLIDRLVIISAEIIAKIHVDSAEEELKNNTIELIQNKINIAQASIDNISTGTVKTQLQNRINDVQTAIEAIEAVNTAEDSMETIPVEELLSVIIGNAEAKIKIAEAEVKKIKDVNVRITQQNRIKEIKLVVAAIKAVDKAETTKSTSNVKSAKTAIGKITKAEYSSITEELNARIKIVDDNIIFEDAEKLIVKAESSLKRTDYNKAKQAVDKLDINEGKGLELDKRRQDIETIILAKEAVENAEKLMKSNKEKASIYDAMVSKASEAYKTANEKIEVTNEIYKDILKQLKNRIDEMQTAIVAIGKVDDAEESYNKYLISNIPGEELENAIQVANENVEKIESNNSNLSSIKKSLQSRLKVFSDRLTADVNYNKVSGELNEIEKALITKVQKTGKELDNAIDELEGKISGIAELSKKVKVSSQSKDIKDRTSAINDVIAATKLVVKAKVRDEKTLIKDIAAAKKAIEKLSVSGIHKKIKDIQDIKDGFETTINSLAKEVETLNNESKATTLVDKAIISKKETDIKVAIEAVSKLEDKKGLDSKIETHIVQQLISDANNSIITTISSIEFDDKSLSKNVGEAKRTSQLVNSVMLLVNGKLNPKGDSNVDYATKYKTEITDMNNSIKVIDISVDALKAVQQSEKTKTQGDFDKAKKAIESILTDPIDPNSKYASMIAKLNTRNNAIKNHIDEESTKEEIAEAAVIAAENEMTVEGNPDYILIQTAQKAVDIITDKTIKLTWQKRIDDIQVAKDAKFAVIKATTILNDKNIKDAETVVGKINDRYFSIIENLTDEIARLKKQLNIDKLVTEAAKIVQKAVASRRSDDIISARWALRSIEELDDKNDPKNPYNTLKEILDDLDDSIKNEAGDQTAALKEAKASLKKAIEEIYGIEAVEGVEATDGVNTDIINIDQNDPEKVKIEKAYGRIQIARNHIAVANAAVGRLRDKGQQKDLSQEIDSVNKGIDLADDKIDILEAVRLVTIASSSATNAKDKQEKAKAKLDIDAARRAVDKIGHSDHKAIKSTFVNTINAVEKKLSTDNDQGLIDLAIDAVNSAADILAKAVKDNMVKENQDQIDKAIFAARIAISGISDNNKGSKDTLTGFINDIAAMFVSEKDGILNDERIKNAEKAVTDAESKKGTDELENFIRSARLKVRMIQKDGYPETELIIEGLNNRLDILEGKSGGSSGNGGSGGNKPGTGGSGSNKPGGSSGSNKPGSGGTTPGAIIPTSPISDKDRLIGTTDPIWGKTNQLNKKNPTTDIPNYNMSSIRVMESKINITELSNMLKAAPNANAKLVVRGKNIKLDSKPYIHDKVNNCILLPIKFLGDEIGFSVSLIDNPTVKGAKRLLINGIVDGKVKSIIIDIGSEYSYVNGSLVKVSSKAVIQAGRTYIPIDFMVEHFGLTFSYYKEGNNIQLIIN